MSCMDLSVYTSDPSLLHFNDAMLAQYLHDLK